jgi:hypothetical protein
MSDVIVGQIITGVVSLVSLYMTLVITRKQNKSDEKVDGLGKSIDGMKTELVEATKLKGEAEGNLQGRKERAEEQAPVNASNLEAAKALGNLEGRQELKDESKRIIPK